MLRQLPFRKRLLVILSLFALAPAVVVTAAWGIAVGLALPMFSETTAWERLAGSGNRMLDSLRDARITPGQRNALRQHELELEQSLTQARRFRFLAGRAVPGMALGAVLGLAVLGLLASRVAGHLSRQLSRPLNELVGWTELIARGKPLPPSAPPRGAPEFHVLRERMRRMAEELAEGRHRALESERLAAFRESARRFAHELKNPLTPIQFAMARLVREAPPELSDVVDVLRTETLRLDRMSRAFAQFGRLPEGPVSDVDVAELVRYTVRATIPLDLAVDLDIAEGLPMIRGHHDALQRALSNVLLNAVDACGAVSPTDGGNGLDGGSPTAGGDASRPAREGRGSIRIGVARGPVDGSDAVTITVGDSGAGIPPERIENIWEPYVTSKPGGTGLGLAIARQTILAHHGSVSAGSEPGRGTEIRIVLPIRPVTSASSVEP
jgi:signal transduction histidine kinase